MAASETLTLFVRGGGAPLAPLPVRWSGAADAFASYAPRAGGFGDLSVTLPPKTAPGKYDAAVVFPDGDQKVVLDVAADPRLTFYPSSVEVTAGATATVMALNEGNAAAVIPASGEVALREYDEQWFDRVVRGESRLLEAWAGKPAGTMRLEVTSGAGALEADAARELVLTFHLPDNLPPGAAYSGSWDIGGGSLEITAGTTNEEQTP